MTTLKSITNGINLTETELIVLDYLYNELSDYFGETYSDIDCADIAKDLQYNVKSIKGIVGSLVKKGILDTFDTGTGFDVIHFVKQEDMTE